MKLSPEKSSFTLATYNWIQLKEKKNFADVVVMADFHEPPFGGAHAATNFERPSDGLFGPVFNSLAYSIGGSYTIKQHVY